MTTTTTTCERCGPTAPRTTLCVRARVCQPNYTESLVVAARLLLTKATLRRSSASASVCWDRHAFMARFSTRHAHATLRNRPRAHCTNSAVPPVDSARPCRAPRDVRARTLHDRVALPQSVLLHALHQPRLLRPRHLNAHSAALHVGRRRPQRPRQRWPRCRDRFLPPPR
jgi:hypothetical protein